MATSTKQITGNVSINVSTSPTQLSVWINYEPWGETIRQAFYVGPDKYSKSSRLAGTGAQKTVKHPNNSYITSTLYEVKIPYSYWISVIGDSYTWGFKTSDSSAIANLQQSGSLYMMTFQVLKNCDIWISEDLHEGD